MEMNLNEDGDSSSDSDNEDNMIVCEGSFKRPDQTKYPVTTEIDPIDRSNVYDQSDAKLEITILFCKIKDELGKSSFVIYFIYY